MEAGFPAQPLQEWWSSKGTEYPVSNILCPYGRTTVPRVCATSLLKWNGCLSGSELEPFSRTCILLEGLAPFGMQTGAQLVAEGLASY